MWCSCARPAARSRTCANTSIPCARPRRWTLRFFTPTRFEGTVSLMLSARNQFNGTVKSVKLGNVMAEVVIAVGDLEVVSAITRGSVDQMGIKVGDQVVAVIKSTEVMIKKGS